MFFVFIVFYFFVFQFKIRFVWYSFVLQKMPQQRQLLIKWPVTQSAENIPESIAIAEALHFLNSVFSSSTCGVKCHAKENNLNFFSNFVNIKNCTIVCAPVQVIPVPTKASPFDGTFIFNASNITDHFYNVQGNNINFSYSGNSERKKKNKPSVLVNY